MQAKKNKKKRKKIGSVDRIDICRAAETNRDIVGDGWSQVLSMNFDDAGKILFMEKGR